MHDTAEAELMDRYFAGLPSGSPLFEYGGLSKTLSDIQSWVDSGDGFALTVPSELPTTRSENQYLTTDIDVQCFGMVTRPAYAVSKDN